MKELSKKKIIYNQNIQNTMYQQSKTKTIKQVILSSLMEHYKVFVQSNRQQIQLLLSQIESGKHITVIPIVSEKKHKGLVQIYSIRDNKKLLKYRMLRRRASITKEPKQNIQNLIFYVQPNLLVNCILLGMAHNEVINITIGFKKTMRQQEINQQIVQMENAIKVYNGVQTFLRQKYEYTHCFIPDEKNEEEKGRKCFKSAFSQLKQLKINADDEQLFISEWTQALKIISHILFYVKRSSLNLQKLYVNIFDSKKYSQQLCEKNAIIDQQIEKISSSIKSILNSKIKRKDNQSPQGYFPCLTDISFNPMLLIKHLCNAQKNENNNDKNLCFNQNKQLQNNETSLRSLHLISMSSQINLDNNLQLLIQFLKPYFSYLVHLQIKMVPEVYFQKFNQLCACMYKCSPLLQSLQIYDNVETQNKQPGLRDILSKYPYLSDLKIKLCPKLNSDNNPDPNNKREWQYIKAILLRRVQIQKYINMIKILEKEGYDAGHCMRIIEFMKPLKFASFDQ